MTQKRNKKVHQKDSWYYIENNKTQGPVFKEQIVRKIQSGELGPFDLIYKKGEEKWQELAQVKEFHCVFTSLPIQLQKEWIVLSENLSQKGQFNMKGPFSTIEVQNKIQAGQMSYLDYVWKAGMTRWYQVSHLKEFNPQKHKRVEFPKTKKEDLKDFFVSVPDEVIEIKNIMIQRETKK